MRSSFGKSLTLFATLSIALSSQQLGSGPHLRPHPCPPEVDPVRTREQQSCLNRGPTQERSAGPRSSPKGPSCSNLATQDALTATGAEEEVVPAPTIALQKQVRELQRLLGKKTLEAEVLEEAREVAAGPRKEPLRSVSLPRDTSR